MILETGSWQAMDVKMHHKVDVEYKIHGQTDVLNATSDIIDSIRYHSSQNT